MGSYFLTGPKDSDIAVLGYSMGTAPAVDLAAHHEIDLILDRYFASMAGVAQDQANKVAAIIFRLGGAGFDVAKKIQKVKGRILLARGLLDDTMGDRHERILKCSLQGNSRALFENVHSEHLHNSIFDLWFSPTNPQHESLIMQNFLKT